MFCSGCGNPLKDGSKFCEFCGAPVADAGSGTNASSSGTGAGGSPFDSAPSPFDALGGLNQSSEPNPWSATPSAGISGAGEDVGSDFLWLNMASILFCCCLPTTIVGLCYSVSARTAKGDGAWDKARARVIVAKTLFWVHLALAVIFWGLALFGASLPKTETDEPSVIEQLEKAVEEEWRDAEIDSSNNGTDMEDDSAKVDDSK